MKVLVVGSGGREHALCYKLAQSPEVEQIFCAPGNPGTAACATNTDIAPSQIDRLVDFADREGIGLTVVGPEQPLCDGLVDRLGQRGLIGAGPTAAAARLEGSKAFAKQFMQRQGIPTAPFGVFDSQVAADALIDANPLARVIKADGLAAGKGVYLTREAAEAKAAVAKILGGAHGEAGRQVLVEDRLDGEEVSVIALCDGERVMPLASSQDHKAALDGDRGPNTGGMGAYSPAPVLDQALQQRVVSEILEPTVRGMAAEGSRYRGVLYAGLMIVEGRPYVLEYNCRFGDPECQPLMARMADDLLPYLHGTAVGRLPEQPPRWDERAARCVVLAAEGYPGSYPKGRLIEGLEAASALEDVVVFHAGTALDGEHLVTAGGRVLGVTGLGADIAGARQAAYCAAEMISWEGRRYRTDIGHRALRPRMRRGAASAVRD